ncbi:MAG: hypothetical protein V8S27_06710 [Lachnospiraceae bacterium]
MIFDKKADTRKVNSRQSPAQQGQQRRQGQLSSVRELPWKQEQIGQAPTREQIKVDSGTGSNTETGRGWDPSVKGRAIWAPVESAKYYQIFLVKDGREIGIMRSIYRTNYDFSDLLPGAGTYQFKVRSVRSGNNAKESDGCCRML